MTEYWTQKQNIMNTECYIVNTKTEWLESYVGSERINYCKVVYHTVPGTNKAGTSLYSHLTECGDFVIQGELAVSEV